MSPTEPLCFACPTKWTLFDGRQRTTVSKSGPLYASLNKDLLNHSSFIYIGVSLLQQHSSEVTAESAKAKAVAVWASLDLKSQDMALCGLLEKVY